jgi:hypothetical protein
LPNRGAGFARPVRKQRSVLLGSRISCSGRKPGAGRGPREEDADAADCTDLSESSTAGSRAWCTVGY